MKRRGLGVRSSIVLSLGIVLVAAVSGIIPFRKVLGQQQSVDLATAQRDALVNENLRLEAEAAALQTPAEVERLAREQFGLVMPGEIAYIAVPTEDVETTVSTVPIALPAAPRSWWQTLWDFITGSDLAGDG